MIKREEQQAADKQAAMMKSKYIATGVMYDVNPNQGKPVLPPLPEPTHY